MVAEALLQLLLLSQVFVGVSVASSWPGSKESPSLQPSVAASKSWPTVQPSNYPGSKTSSKAPSSLRPPSQPISSTKSISTPSKSAVLSLPPASSFWKSTSAQPSQSSGSKPISKVSSIPNSSKPTTASSKASSLASSWPSSPLSTASSKASAPPSYSSPTSKGASSIPSNRSSVPPSKSSPKKPSIVSSGIVKSSTSKYSSKPSAPISAKSSIPGSTKPSASASKSSSVPGSSRSGSSVAPSKPSGSASSGRLSGSVSSGSKYSSKTSAFISFKSGVSPGLSKSSGAVSSKPAASGPSFSSASSKSSNITYTGKPSGSVSSRSTASGASGTLSSGSSASIVKSTQSGVSNSAAPVSGNGSKGASNTRTAPGSYPSESSNSTTGGVSPTKSVASGSEVGSNGGTSTKPATSRASGGIESSGIQGGSSPSSGAGKNSTAVSPVTGSQTGSGSSPTSKGPSGSAPYSASATGKVSGTGKPGSPSAGGSLPSSGGSCPASCTAACPSSDFPSGPTATLGCGVVRGTTTSLPAATATVNKFLGVPYAKSPPRRFSPPEKAGNCNVDATAWKPACIQQFVYPKIVQEFTELVFNAPGGSPPVESEDCLYLNVYAPSSPPPAGGRAVLFWIYGGALQFGTAGQPTYDGSYFAAYEDVIVVTHNYRTNVFGFASSPELPTDQRNLGFLDQRAALDWVQENVAAFGGDPEKVTIFGESAGGFSVDALLTSYSKDTKPPFRGAIMESGQISYSASSRPSTEPQWNQLASILGCGNYSSNLACLRRANASAIKNAIEVNILEFNPTADNVTLVSNPLQRRLNGDIYPVPVLTGSNAQEGRVFALGQTNTTAYLESLIGSNDTQTLAEISTIEAAYPLNSSGIGGTEYDQSAQIFTELVFQCAAAFYANASAAVGIPTWRYYFNATFSNTQEFPGLGVYHASEIPIVFSTYPRTNVTAQEYALSRSMRSAWAAFAKNPVNGPGWNPVGTGVGGDVLVSGVMYDYEEGAIYISDNGTASEGAWNLGVFGNIGNVLGSGVTVIDSSEVDYRCGLFASTYQHNAVIGG